MLGGEDPQTLGDSVSACLQRAAVDVADFADRAGVPVMRVAPLNSDIHPAFERPSLIILTQQPPCLPLGAAAESPPDAPCIPKPPGACDPLMLSPPGACVSGSKGSLSFVRYVSQLLRMAAVATAAPATQLVISRLRPYCCVHWQRLGPLRRCISGRAPPGTAGLGEPDDGGSCCAAGLAAQPHQCNAAAPRASGEWYFPRLLDGSFA